MTEAQLAKTVARAIALDREIEEKSDELKELKSLLIAEATSRQDEHTTTESGGATWTATAPDGAIARVSFPIPALKSKIDSEAKNFEKVKAAAGRFFLKLFNTSVTYKPVEAFREEATTLLGKDAGKLIRLCQTESAPKVAFETRQASAA